MIKDLDYLLLALDEEIEKKCYKIKKKKVEQRLTKFFIYTCIMFLIIPALLVFAGVNLLSIFIPIVLFIALAMFAFSPIIFNNNLGGIR